MTSFLVGNLARLNAHDKNEAFGCLKSHPVCDTNRFLEVGEATLLFKDCAEEDCAKQEAWSIAYSVWQVRLATSRRGRGGVMEMTYVDIRRDHRRGMSPVIS